MIINLSKFIRDILVSASESLYGHSRPSTKAVQEWRDELRNNPGLPTAQDDRESLYQDGARVARDFNKALSDYKDNHLVTH